MTALVMVDERNGTVWRVWPDPEPVAPGTVQELSCYLFELRGYECAAEVDLLIDDVKLEALRTSSSVTARWRWSPGFHAGTVEAELRMPGRAPLRFEVVTDPDLRKLTRNDFDVMVREILEDTFALFSLSSFRKGIARGVGGQPPAIARLEFLRTRVEELEDIVAGIQRNPRHMLTAEKVAVPYYRASRVTGPEILHSFHSGRIVQETVWPSRLPTQLKGFLPKIIRTRLRRNSLDIPEHRQMGACLRSWATWLRAAAEMLERSSPKSDPELRQSAATWATRCRRIARRVSQLAIATPFLDAGEGKPHLVMSAIFRNDPLYRRFYRIWQDINLGIAAVFGDFLNLPLARTYELYELWCFLRLIRAGTEEFGSAGIDVHDLFTTNAEGGLTLATGAVTVKIGKGWKFCFQRQYREYWIEPDRKGSYSRTMTPDVVVARESTTPEDIPQLIILDAKYRIDSSLNDAISSIHTYRDALVREGKLGSIEGIVTAAYLVTPYIPTLDNHYRTTPLPGRLFHPEYRDNFRFGAITFRPGMTTSEIATVLKRVVSDATLTKRPKSP